ncbi:BZ3500_MvSof-1268-A1-R1_Chr9g10536 [Microbotryum saponariae]|uniref:BZ3500_MvSof-1268-A1-R1_Chr9g10536 protein n=1 Tax=Microbotryum saponariae TaxID=289078 RepID=A0A2X0MCV8_9BASI|nr:BZ3501_MvSof-1269-A2-R1_Chr9g10285 [Microbotryum saponariae]SDA00254.1 BZ3500_MvSof-1268-A1-R1_Chr9g10536 [Microbotryum saponariae]
MSTSTSSLAATASAAASTTKPASYKIIGICLAVGSGLFIGTTSRQLTLGGSLYLGFVVKKKGLLASQQKSGNVAGEGHAYLKSWLWWTGMILMILGEVLNFVAYAFTEAVLVTPLGALSVVICAILSSIFLKERLTFFGKIGCVLAILGATIVALNGPKDSSATTIPVFQKLFLAPGFLVFGSLVILVSLGLIFFVAPKYGKTHMLVYITICSLIGGLSVACTSGLGASILTSIRGDNQFKHWFIYFLLGFVIITLLTEINYLNKALELYNTAMVTPTYYVLFTGCTLITASILNQGFEASPVDIVTVVMGFLVICCGIILLQLSKVDPVDVAEKLDRRSTILFTGGRSRANTMQEKVLEMEEPGMDALRGSFGAFGSIHRAVSARRSMRREPGFDPNEVRRRHGAPGAMGSGPQQSVPMRSYQLYDAPMPSDALDKISLHSGGQPSPSAPFAQTERDRSPSITFSPADNVHRYARDPRSKQGVSHDEVTLQPHAHEHHGPVDAPSSADIGTSSFLGASAPRTPSPSSIDRIRHGSYPLPSSTSVSPYPPRLEPPQLDAPEQLISPASKSRFGISMPFIHHDSSSSKVHENNANRSRAGTLTSHRSFEAPHGPKDLDQAESKSLVNHARTDSKADSESDGEDGFGESIERIDTRDQL